MLSNAYFLAKIRFDTAENEPAKNLQKFAKFSPGSAHRPPAALEMVAAFQLSTEDVEARAFSLFLSLSLSKTRDNTDAAWDREKASSDVIVVVNYLLREERSYKSKFFPSL